MEPTKPLCKYCKEFGKECRNPTENPDVFCGCTECHWECRCDHLCEHGTDVGKPHDLAACYWGCKECSRELWHDAREECEELERQEYEASRW